MGTYTCPVCGGIHSEGDRMSTECHYCKKRVCTYCSELYPAKNIEVCDNCADAIMFNHVEMHYDASLLKQQEAE